MTYHFFTDEQTVDDLYAVLTRFGQEVRVGDDHADQNWIDLYDDDPKNILSAAAALMRHAFVSRRIDIMMPDVWAAAFPHLPPAMDPTRAAFAHAILGLCEKTLPPSRPPLKQEDLLSVEKAALEPGLLTLARGLKDHIDAISRADYADQADDHRRALEAMLATDFANVPLSERWLPMEVIALASHGHGHPGHIPALAIVLLDALRNDNMYDCVDFRWEDQREDILAMPVEIRTPLLAAFRYFHEFENTYLL